MDDLLHKGRRIRTWLMTARAMSGDRYARVPSGHARDRGAGVIGLPVRVAARGRRRQRPGKPADNAFLESFNGRLSDRCLNESWFRSLLEAQEGIEVWRQNYNKVRPHSALGDRPPSEYVGTSQPRRTEPNR